jgi:serine protease Do
MEDNKRDYSDFFKPQDSSDQSPEQRNEPNGQHVDEASKKDRPSYYYSYGPYKSAFQDKDDNGMEPAASSVTDTEGTSSVEMTTPRALRPFSIQSDQGQPAPAPKWQFEKKRSSVRSVFSAFLAGALVVGGLMFASDKMNMFSDQPLSANGSTPASASNAAAGSGAAGGDVKQAAMDVVRPNNIAEIAQNASPAIVKIEAFVKAQASNRSGNSLFNDPFFRQFFGDDFGGQQQQPKSGKSGSLQPAGMGTGFIFEKSGYILTNEHVIEGADEIHVTVEGYEKPFVAKLLGNSYDLDLAVLKIENDKDLPILPMGDANAVNVGDWVVAIGNPYGFDHTVTVGVLSAKERPISIPDSQGTREYKHLLQTDASINPGNSGGPLLNLNGEVIGINTAVSSQAQGIGFAIPTSTISSVLDNLKNNVTIPKEPIPYLGVGLQDIDKEWVTELKLENNEGALVGTVERRTPAFVAGLRPYDVIVDINGTKVKNSQELITKVQASKVGDKLTVGVIRDGKRMDITVEVGDKNTFGQQE